MMKFLCAAVAATALTFGGSANAAFLPSGPQLDVFYGTVTGAWGWTEIYRGGYGEQLTFNDMFDGAGAYIILGGIQDGSETIDVLAAVKYSDFLTATGLHQTNLFNGSEWYLNGSSLGFAGAGDSIFQQSADTNGSTSFGGIGERDRLSWHTHGNDGFGRPTNVNGGWRSGDNTFLNSEPSGWDRVIFTSNSVGVVPEPATWGLMIVGFGAAGASLRANRRRALAA